MSNKIKREIEKIEIPVELHLRSKLGVQKAKLEMNKNKRYKSKGIAFVASLFVLLGGYRIYNHYIHNDHNQAMPNPNTPIVTEDKGVQIPAIQLPENSESADMIGLIVYNGKIYTQTKTEIDVNRAKDLLGEKLGTTKGTIDEWSKQDEYAVEFASSIGKADVYTVKGYDKEFRIMTYDERGGEVFSEFYECLNGITVHDGRDVFGKLKLTGNILNAQYRNFSDWDYNVDNYYPVEDINALNAFIEELNDTVPHTSEHLEDKIGDFRNDEEFKELILHLNDGTKVSLVVIKGGYVQYGYTNLYFKMDDEQFAKMWEQLNIE
jgi:hypothetical protein